MSTEAPRTSWDVFWNNFEEDSSVAEIFKAEAADFVDRLDTAGPIQRQWRVLDFGCGSGHVAQLLAPIVKELWLWDASPRMRRQSARRVARHDNVVMIDSSDQLIDKSSGAFDLVLVNSVIQYMNPAELAEWLVRWRDLIGNSGRLVISDIHESGRDLSAEVGSLLWFSIRNRFLTSAVRYMTTRGWRYVSNVRSRSLLKLSREEIAVLAKDAGLSAEFYSKNLTYRRRRISVCLAALHDHRPASQNGDDGELRAAQQTNR